MVNGIEDNSVVVDDTHLAFKTTLDTLGQSYVLDYDVTNSSKQYDAQLTMNCTGGNEYLTVVNSFDTVNNLLATDTRRGKLTLTLAKSYSGADMDVEIVCTLGANAVERNSMATGTPKDPVAVCKWEYEDLDDVKSNVFDIKTSKAMAEVEKQSFGNMISQLNIEENDYINVLANQRDRISELENDLLKMKEKNRAKTKRINKLEERLRAISENDKNEEDN